MATNTTSLEDLGGGAAGDAAEEDCFLCDLVDDEDEPVEDRFVSALSYGAIVLGAGHGLAFCDVHRDALKAGCAEVRKELRRSRG
jgi:hypothetical protein